MFTEAVKRVVERAGQTPLGRNVIHAVVLRDPRLARFENVRTWPASLEGFDDLAFLFSSNQLNHGIVSQQLDEAALLYRLVRSFDSPTIAEIGRFKGGGTFLIAAAMDEGGELYSYDLHVPIRADFTGVDLDRALLDALRRYGLEQRVHLVVGDSRTAEPPPRPCDLILIDGDHSYEGVKADWERWRHFLRAGGHVLFHDAVDTGGFSTLCGGVARLIEEIERGEKSFARAPWAGCTAHFVRHPETGEPAAARDQAAISL